MPTVLWLPMKRRRKINAHVSISASSESMQMQQFQFNQIFRQFVPILISADDCIKDGKPCINGACISHECVCNDGFGGCNCDIPGNCRFHSLSRPSKRKQCERIFSFSPLNCSELYFVYFFQTKTNATIDRVMCSPNARTPLAVSSANVEMVIAVTVCTARISTNVWIRRLQRFASKMQNAAISRANGNASATMASKAMAVCCAQMWTSVDATEPAEWTPNASTRPAIIRACVGRASKEIRTMDVETSTNVCCRIHVARVRCARTTRAVLNVIVQLVSMVMHAASAATTWTNARDRLAEEMRSAETTRAVFSVRVRKAFAAIRWTNA